jgi:beta-glucosidase
LSYSTFSYSSMEVIPSKLPDVIDSDTVVATVIFTLKNEGVDGADVVQLYLGYPKLALEPLHQLRDFAKVALKSGQEKTLRFTVTAKDCSIWDSYEHNWKLIRGKFSVYVGSSSRNLPLSADLVV